MLVSFEFAGASSRLTVIGLGLVRLPRLLLVLLLGCGTPIRNGDGDSANMPEDASSVHGGNLLSSGLQASNSVRLHFRLGNSAFMLSLIERRWPHPAIK